MEENAELIRLMDRIIERDETAFARFYDLSAPAAYGLAARIVEDPGFAEDVVAEAYVQVWQKASQYRHDRGGVMSWLLVIVRSRAIDLLRKRRLTVQTEELARGTAVAVEHQETVPDFIDRIETRTIVHEALSGLPHGQRQLLALAFFRGLTHSEIAQHTGMPLGTVKSMLRSSIHKLRGTLNTGPGKSGPEIPD